jgi:hypothetical protein
MIDYERGSELIIGFTDHLQIVTTTNHSAIADLHNLHISRARNKPSQSAVFTSRCLVATSNDGRSSYYGLPNYPCASATSF